MTKGIVYYIWDDYSEKDLRRSVESAERNGYNYCIVDSSDLREKGYAKRHELWKRSPFDINLHLDTDTKILSNLRFGFEMAERWGLALCIAPASSAYHAQNGKACHVDAIQYNCGAMFYNKNNEHVKEVFKYWGLALKVNPNSQYNDQPYLSQAIEDYGFNPFVLPKTWNYRPHLKYHGAYHGELKILHSKHDI